MTEYLTNYNNQNLQINKDFEEKPILTLIGLPVSDISADAFNFDIGIEGETAIVSGVCTIISPLVPHKIEFTIPANAFTKTHRKLILQIRWTPNGENERIVSKRFFDVRNPVTPL